MNILHNFIQFKSPNFIMSIFFSEIHKLSQESKEQVKTAIMAVAACSYYAEKSKLSSAKEAARGMAQTAKDNADKSVETVAKVIMQASFLEISFNNALWKTPAQAEEAKSLIDHALNYAPEIISIISLWDITKAEIKSVEEMVKSLIDAIKNVEADNIVSAALKITMTLITIESVAVNLAMHKTKKIVNNL